RIRSGGALQFLVVNPAMPHNSRHPSLVSEWNLSTLPSSGQRSQNIIFPALLQDGSLVAPSSRSYGERTQQRPGSIPKNLDANANQEEGREPQDDAHAGFADERGEVIGEAVAKINARGDEERRDHRG